MRSGGIISRTLKSLPTSGNAIPLAQLTWRCPAQVPTRVTPDGGRLPRRKTRGTEDVDGELSLDNNTRDTSETSNNRISSNVRAYRLVRTCTKRHRLGRPAEARRREINKEAPRNAGLFYAA